MKANVNINITHTIISFLIFVLVAGLALSPGAQASIFGLKSCGSNSPGFCGSGKIDNSLPPTNLFSFQEDGSGFADIGAVTLGGSSIDADALALSPTYGLLAFELHKSGFITTGSTLISIDSGTAVATSIGLTLNGRDIRGAVFDQSDTLWAIDAANDEVLKINSITGAVVGTPVGLTLGGNPYDLTNVSDIAVRQNGIFFLIDFNDFYTLDMQSGALALVNTDTVQLSGVAFSNNAAQDALFAYDVGDDDDILRYDADSGFIRTTLHTDIIPSFNAGRGDLASLTVVRELSPDIKANGSDGSVTLTQSDPLSITVELNATGYSDDADWWALANTPFSPPYDWYHYNLFSGWQPGINVTYSGALLDLSTYEIMNMKLPAGEYTFYFGVDLIMNGTLNTGPGEIYYDSVDVTVTP